MTWIRIDTGIKGDPRIGALADAIGTDVGAAIGHVVALLTELPQHARAGDLADVPDSVLETWALWRGPKGKFSKAFLAVMCEGRVVRAWQKHNGVPLRETDEKREAMRAARAAKRGGTPPPPFPPSGGNVTPTVGPTLPERGANVPPLRNVTERKEKDLSWSVADAPDPDGPPAGQPRASARGEPDGFAAAWDALPKRAGSNPRRDAAKAYRGRLREGVAPAEMLDGARRYAAYVVATGKAGTEFVMRGSRFFGPSREFADVWTPPGDGGRAEPDIAVAEWRRMDDDADFIAERLRRQGLNGQESAA